MVVGWDFIYQIAEKEPLFIVNSSKSAVNHSDKQDPSLVADIAHLYGAFIDEEMFAMGIYLKSIQCLTEAFFDDNLTPGERIQKAWYTKTLLVLWYENVSKQHFISKETFSDVKCLSDGLLLYFLLLRRSFPDSPVIPKLLGSDSCERAFAFFRCGQYSGRRTNVDALRLAQGLEKLNRHSEVVTEIDSNDAAHTRGRRVLLRPPGYKPPEQPTRMFFGRDINVRDLIQFMEQGTKDCLYDCQKFRLDFVALAAERSSGHSDKADYEVNTEEMSDDEEIIEDDESDFLTISVTRKVT
jgi:hypothetical protein